MISRDTYYCGVFKNRPHTSMIDDEKCVLLYKTRKEAEALFNKVEKVKIVRVK